MDPLIAQLQTLLTAPGAWADVLNLIQVRTSGIVHDNRSRHTFGDIRSNALIRRFSAHWGMPLTGGQIVATVIHHANPSADYLADAQTGSWSTPPLHYYATWLCSKCCSIARSSGPSSGFRRQPMAPTWCASTRWIRSFEAVMRITGMADKGGFDRCPRSDPPQGVMPVRSTALSRFNVGLQVKPLDNVMTAQQTGQSAVLVQHPCCQFVIPPVTVGG